MTNKQKEFIGIKLDTVSLIILDSRAESLGMNRSEFIKYCINQEIERSKNEAEVQAKLNDFERLMATLIEINSGIHHTKTLSVKGIATIQKAFMELYPDNARLREIFEVR